MPSFEDDVQLIASLFQDGEGHEVRIGVGLLDAILTDGSFRIYDMKCLDERHREAALRLIETYAKNRVNGLHGILSVDQLDEIARLKVLIASE